MNSKFKKILIIIVIILILVLIGLLIYNFVIKKNVAPTNNGTTNNNLPSGQNNNNSTNGQTNNQNNGQEQGQEQGNQQPQTESKLKAISISAVLSPTITSDKANIIYYSKVNGNIIQSDFNGLNQVTISDANLENLVKVLWAPNKNKTITIFQDNLENVSKYLYNFSDKKSLPLNKYVSYISWSPDSSKIVYQYQNTLTDDNNISTSLPDGSKFSTILKTRMKDLIVEWPSDIYLREKPSGLAQSTLYSLNVLSGSLNKLITDVYGFSIKWSPKGNKMLYSKTSSKGQGIYIFTADNNGTNEKATGISTVAEKCTWSQDIRYIFCAVPKNISDAKVLPDDFYKGTFIGDDEFYKINVSTGEKLNLLQDEEINISLDAIDLFLSPQEDYLFFTNKGDGLLYRIKL